MSIKALFGSKEPKTVPPPPVEETVSDISKDLVTTIAKLEARTKALDVKISLAEAAAAAANEAKRQAIKADKLTRLREEYRRDPSPSNTQYGWVWVGEGEPTTPVGP